MTVLPCALHSYTSTQRCHHLQAFQSGPARSRAHVKCVCRCQRSAETPNNAQHGAARLCAAAGLLSLSLALTPPSLADLNKFEAAAGGEFGVGTAMQYGDAELRGKDFSGQVSIDSILSKVAGTAAVSSRAAHTRTPHHAISGLETIEFHISRCKECKLCWR